MTVWANGLGPVDPEVPIGSAAPVDSLSRTTLSVQASIGQALAPVTFSGLAPGFVGLYQLNIQVPEEGLVGRDAPIFVSVNGSPTQEGVQIAVQ